MSKEKDYVKTYYKIASVISLLLAIGKLSALTDMSWFWVALPLLLPVILLIIVAFLVAIFSYDEDVCY